MAKKKNSKPFWKRINPRDERWIKLAGIFTLFFSILLFVSICSYLFTWKYDQDKVLNFSWKIFLQKDLAMANTLGRFGAFLSHQAIYWSFGLPAFAFVYIGLLYAWKWIRNGRYRLMGRTLGILWVMLYTSVLLESFLGRLAFPFGGAIGEWIAYYLQNFLGLAGLIGLLLLVVILLAVWNFNPDFSKLRLPSYQFSGEGAFSGGTASFLNYFRKPNKDPLPEDRERESILSETGVERIIERDFKDPEENDLHESPTLELEVYKPQYADLTDLKGGEQVMDF
ncbi:MAG TPA: DNA translocase FtsK 4TM domain-containing protein, partial [Saprospiraceae bacterium]|nr:DNA translocase FtsK 4TM domain-containing protein [Saprospiraceae bacterium]